MSGSGRACCSSSCCLNGQLRGGRRRVYPTRSFEAEMWYIDIRPSQPSPRGGQARPHTATAPCAGHPNLHEGSTWRPQKERKRTCEHPFHLARQMTDDPPSLYLDRTRRFASILAHTADFRHHAGITLQAVPKMKYALRLFVDNEERELERINNWTWEPAQPLYAPRFNYMCTL